jgi:phosphate/sulfate permease
MMRSLLPLRITAALATGALALVAFSHGAVDAQVAMTTLGGVLTYLLGVITHNDPPAPPPADKK